MKHLFVVRHGKYGSDNRINDSGRQQMEALGKSIKEILNGSSIHLLSSTAPRALDSSEVLITQLALPKFEQVLYLWSGSDAPKDSYYWNPSVNKLMELIAERKDKAEGIIMMTHLEVAEEFPTHFLRKELGQDKSVGEVLKGQAVHLDLEKRTYQFLPR